MQGSEASFTSGEHNPVTTYCFPPFTHTSPSSDTGKPYTYLKLKSYAPTHTSAHGGPPITSLCISTHKLMWARVQTLSQPCSHKHYPCAYVPRHNHAHSSYAHTFSCTQAQPHIQQLCLCSPISPAYLHTNTCALIGTVMHITAMLTYVYR